MFEQRIHKKKLPKGWSYPIQTSKIKEHLNTENMALSYAYNHDNPDKVKYDFYTVKIILFYIHKHKMKTYPEIMKVLNYDTFLYVYSVPSVLKKQLEQGVLMALPHINNWQKRNTEGHVVTVYYESFKPTKWEPLDRGGLYIVQDYGGKEQLLFRDKSFNIDESLQEYLK